MGGKSRAYDKYPNLRSISLKLDALANQHRRGSFSSNKAEATLRSIEREAEVYFKFKSRSTNTQAQHVQNRIHSSKGQSILRLRQRAVRI